MIHNITEERKKLNRCDASLPAPLSEEELTRLIETIEERELLRAPGHLRENIFAQIQEGKRRERQRALFSYRAKVLVGMAAALAVLYLVPVDGVETWQGTQADVTETLYEEAAESVDEWEQDTLERQRDIEKTWKRYQAGQERADARKRYLRKFTEQFRNHADWED